MARLFSLPFLLYAAFLAALCVDVVRLGDLRLAHGLLVASLSLLKGRHQLVQTGDVIREWFDSLESITKAFGACYDSKPLESEGLCRIVQSSLEEVEKLRKIKNQ
ncbi:MAG TPA: hypothetical protein PKX74_07730, partial [Leptospiraceae bacterium]|nr:hypothetical protein [Leptospiraceae bacterium]